MGCIFLILFSPTCIAQQPACFLFGEEQFRGVKIYDVIQDSSGNYYFASSEGLILFDYYQFRKLSCDKSKSQSYFNFVKNKQGIIYFHNLNGQVFKVRNEKCELVYKMKKDEESPDVSLSVAADNHLLISGRKIIVLDPSEKVVQRFTVNKHYIAPPHQSNTGATIYHLSSSYSLLHYSEGKFSIRKADGLDPQAGVLRFYTLSGNEYAIDLKSKKHYSYTAGSSSFKMIDPLAEFYQNDALRIYETGEEIWAGGTLPGVSLFPDKNNSSLLYPDYFISDVYKDHEGNFLISTFDKGILVVPDLEIKDVVFKSGEDPITSLYFDKNQQLWMGSSKGSLWKHQQQKSELITNKGKRPLEVLTGNPKSEWIIFDNGSISLLNTQTGTIEQIHDASLKDAHILDDQTLILGTNRGLIKLIRTADHGIEAHYIQGIDNRIYAMEYHPEEEKFYVSGSNGLFLFDQSGNLNSVLYQNEEIYPNYLNYGSSSVFAAGKEKGILELKNGKVIHEIVPRINGRAIEIHKVIVHQQQFFCLSSGTLYLFDRNGDLKRTINQVFGFFDKRVIDFALQDGQLAVSHEDGVQLFPLKQLETTTIPPVISIDKILVNDKERHLNSGHSFSSDERKFTISFRSPTIKNRSSVHYHFFLKGYDNNWQSQQFTENSITYSALAPGAYTFYLKAENQGVFSPVLSFSFSIRNPLYLQWWFLGTCAMIFVGIVLIIARRQIRIQRKKSEMINELNASRLTAIQSQMNPHFIFNSLNSIQDLILKGDVEHSYSYITTFSNLVRKTLKYSEKDFIGFEEEIQLLELYLSLEKLRFKRDFTYEINTGDTEDILLPPLLIQPFIENALVHGLLHKEGPKNLKIDFELKDSLICTISDNGVGREKARAIKTRQRSEHESFSGKAIRKRFEILSEVFKGEFGFTYEDLQENGEPAGTRVTLTIPIKRKF